MFDEKLFLEQLDYMGDISDFSIEYIGEPISEEKIHETLHQIIRTYLKEKKGSNVNITMNDSLILNSPHKNFEGIKKIDEFGIEYWEARELMPLLGYFKWSNFDSVVIEKAKNSV